MKIDTAIIKKVMMLMDSGAKDDPEFLHSIELFIFELTRLQKQKNAKDSKKHK